jgi:glutathione synthase/RimK-type ligase-like ATP-grasp enzyme
MITLLYHARTTGAICKQIAAASDGYIKARCDKDNDLPEHFEGTLVHWDSKMEIKADKIINTAAAVKISRNKRESRKLLEGLCPATWFLKRDCHFPCVVRPKRHFGGHNFYLCNNKEELEKASRKCGGIGGYYASEFINKTDEYRVFTLNGETFKVVRRYRADADPKVPWNAHNGGLSKRIKSENWPDTVVDIAERATGKLNLQLCAVDVIVDEEKRVFVLEANTAPGLERQATIKRFAELLMETA